MLEYISRMIREKEEVSAKIKKLKKAISNKKSLKLNNDQLKYMEHQEDIMAEYIAILEKRIEYDKNLHGFNRR